MWSNHDMTGWGYTGMAIGMVLFWVLIIAAIIALVRFTLGTSQARVVQTPPQFGESPEQLLAARFARGEIEESEYQQRLAVLRAAARH